MRDQLYVATGYDGVEHTEDGPVRWTLPDEGAVATAAASGRLFHLRRTSALLDVLEAEIYEAEPASEVTTDEQDVVTASAARLLRRTSWDTRTATSFAIDCAAHAVGDHCAVALPDGTALTAILDDARRAVEGVSNGGVEKLDYWARVSALRRVRHERDKLADLSRGLVYQDEARDVDALDDPRYASVIPVTDAVLAATEALRHHLLPHLYIHLTDRIEERVEARNLDQQTPLSTPTISATAFGPVATGGAHPLPFEPAWSSAREAARHARQAALDLAGERGMASETEWQTARLNEVLVV